MKIDPYYLEKEAKKKKKQKPVYIKPVEYVKKKIFLCKIPPKNISDEAKLMSNSILRQFIYGFKYENKTSKKTEPFNLLHPNSVEKSDFQNKYLPSDFDLKPKYLNESDMGSKKDNLIENKTSSISNFLLSLEVRQKLYEHKFRTKIGKIRWLILIILEDINIQERVTSAIVNNFRCCLI